MKNMNHVRKYSLYRPLHITQSSSFDLRIENMIENILQNYFNFCEIVGRFLFFDGSFLSKRKLITIFVRCPFNTQYAYQFYRISRAEFSPIHLLTVAKKTYRCPKYEICLNLSFVFPSLSLSLSPCKI